MTTESSARLIVGLRNPGSGYDRTRHNIGSVAVARFLDEHGLDLKRARQGIRADIAETNLSGNRIVVTVPRTFMNESGQAVAPLVKYFGIAAARMLVVHDDIDVPFGKLKVTDGGGHGGHNGVRSIIGSLGFDDFWRLKIGVGRPPSGVDPADFVLDRFRPDERESITVTAYRGAEVIESFVVDGGERARQHAGELNI
ncbi:MAG: aminoacyl-tRNA hydrolase [Acidimicrobiia bacterium]